MNLNEMTYYLIHVVIKALKRTDIHQMAITRTILCVHYAQSWQLPSVHTVELDTRTWKMYTQPQNFRMS